MMGNHRLSSWRLGLTTALLLMLLALGPPLSAQEPLPTETPLPPSPTETLPPPSTEIPIPTEAPPTETFAPVEVTEEATPTDTPVPLEVTEEAAPSATLEPIEVTEEPTPIDTPVEVTEEPLASPTAEPLPPEPPMTLLYSETFDAGETPLWNLGAGWSYVPSEGGQALQVTNSTEPATFTNNTIYNAAIDARFQISAGTAWMGIRQSEAGFYAASLSMDGAVSLYRSSELLGTAAVSPLVPGEWHVLRLSAIEGVLRVAVDGVEVIAMQDAAPLPTGAVVFAASDALLVDDVNLWMPIGIEDLQILALDSSSQIEPEDSLQSNLVQPEQVSSFTYFEDFEDSIGQFYVDLDGSLSLSGANFVDAGSTPTATTSPALETRGAVARSIQNSITGFYNMWIRVNVYFDQPYDVHAVDVQPGYYIFNPFFFPIDHTIRVNFYDANVDLISSETCSYPVDPTSGINQEFKDTNVSCDISIGVVEDVSFVSFFHELTYPTALGIIYDLSLDNLTMELEPALIPTPTPAPTSTPLPQVCTGTVIATQPLNVRTLPGGPVSVGHLFLGDVIEILGAAPYRRSDDAEVEWWWYIHSESRNLTGYVYAFWIDGSNCPDPALTIPVPPVPIGPTTVCQMRVPDNAELTVYQVNSNGQRIDTGQRIPSNGDITVYGRSLEAETNFLYLIVDPLNPPSAWRWVHANVVSLINISPAPSEEEKRRACDYNYLPAFRFVDSNASGDFTSALHFYINNFQSPIYNPVYGQHFNSDLYTGPNGHNGLDIVYKSAGANGASEPFLVDAPYVGVVVDVGPDAFVETHKVEHWFNSISEIQPDWVRSCVEQGRTLRGCRKGVYLQVARPDVNSPSVKVSIMFAMTAWGLGNSNENRHDGWDGKFYGLIPDEKRVLIQRLGYAPLCNESCAGPGRQIVIQYDIDSDAIADIQTTYLHTSNVTNSLWQTECSAGVADSTVSSSYAQPHEIWQIVRTNPNCQVASGSPLGWAQFIGFASAPHLHYTVYIDRDGDGQAVPADDETIDPLISRNMLR